MRIETTILKNLIYNEEYTRKVVPFLSEEYFKDHAEKLVFKEIQDFITKYNTPPTYEALLVQLDERNVSQEDHDRSIEIIDQINETKDDLGKIDWLLDKTEKFCQDQAIYNGVLESISILDGSHKTLDKGAIPQILTDALAVSFQKDVGHDFFENVEDRFEYYHRVEEKIPFDIEYLNKITKGGFSKKTINIFLGGPHSGKSLIKCHIASSYLMQGKNVLFISLEMSEEEVAKRIDANITNTSIIDIENMSHDMYIQKLDKARQKTIGRLVVKQFPTGVGNVFHFEHLINELNLKKNFVPDAIIVDYLGICGSVRYKGNASIGSYLYVKAISEELRGLAIKYNVPLITSSQFNRGGSDNSDPGMKDVSESFGINMTGDFICAIISNEELMSMNQYLFKQIKNRYRDLNLDNKFVIGVDRAKMKIYDLESMAQNDIISTNSTTPSKRSFDEFKFD